MSFRIEYFCDACGSKIQRADCEETEKIFISWATEVSEKPESRQVLPESFCSLHRDHAKTYWTARRTMMLTLQKESAARLEKQKNRYWEQYKNVVRLQRESSGAS